MKRILVLLLALLIGSPAFGQSVPQAAATLNGSVVIATGNTFQTVLAAITGNSKRRSITIQNNNTTDSCWLYIGSGAATKGTSMVLLPGGAYTRYFPYVPSDAIQATCTTTADTLYVDTN